LHTLTSIMYTILKHGSMLSPLPPHSSIVLVAGHASNSCPYLHSKHASCL
jgi:hypothetical protein